MATAGYGPSQQRQYLTFYAEQIIPFLGPYPHQFRSAITRSGLPLEFSVNYQQHWGNRPIVRIGLEPVTGNSGTEHDPYNQLPIVDLQGRLAQLELPGYDAALFDHFRSHHTVTVAEQDILKGRKVAGSDISASQMAYGFDLKDSTVSVKGYSFPALKCEVTGKDFGQVIRDSIKPLSSQMGSLPAFGMVDEYMLEAQAYSEFAFFSWDCVQPAKSRLKIYSSSNTVVWSRVEEIWTLGGRLRLPAVVQGLKYLRQLWDAIKLSDGNRAFTGGFDDGNDATPSPMVWNYEVRCNDPIPLTKFYFPVHGESDIAVVRGVAQFLEQIGLVEQGQKYIQTVQHLL
jgi:DMATS type aromatic prenyltransferase